MFFIDDYRRMTWVAFLREKFEDFEKFKAFKDLVENEIDLKIKCPRTDRGVEFTSNEFNISFQHHGIRRQLIATKTPQHNGVVKRKEKKQIVQEMDRTILFKA